MAKNLTVLDPTIREVGFINNWTFSLEQVNALALKSEAAGIKWIEIGHGYGLGNTGMKFTHDQYLAAAKKVIKKAKLSVFALTELCTPKMIKSAAAAGMDRIRIGFVGFDSEYPISGVRELADTARELGVNVSVNMLEAGRLGEKELEIILKELAPVSMDSLYIVDSTGGMLPAQVSEQTKFILANSNFEVGFHGHQQMGMANANTIAAVEAGATWMDATLLGAGRDPGNAQLEVVTAILKKMGYQTGVDWIKLAEAALSDLKPLLPGNTALTLDQISLGYFGVMGFAENWVKEISKENKIDRFKLMEQIDKDRVQFITKEKILTSLAKIK